MTERAQTYSPAWRRDEAVGKGLIAAAIVSTAVIQPMADLSSSHAFNEDWPPHAHFHDLAAIGMLEICCATSLYLLGTKRGDRHLNTAVAAILPAAFWAPFFPAHFIAGSSLDDTTAHHPEPGDSRSTPTPARLPSNLACSPPAGGDSANPAPRSPERREAR